MTSLRKNVERSRGLGLVLFVSLSLAACAESPRTALEWNVNDHFYPRTAHRERAVAAVAYQAQPPAHQRAQIVPTPRPNYVPGWYTQNAQPQAAPASDIQQVSAGDTPVRFQWPVSGRILSGFGAGDNGERNQGIDIAATQGEPIRASASGTVSYCGNELKGYGNLVLIKHDSGYITAYAHASSILVGRGDHVSAGQVIAYAGATGDVDAPQLHFEIRKGVQALNPRSLLPKPTVVAFN
jgi:murein DD-endopeptidase MepM/ murein hydrolase activator NlpD